MRSCTLRTLGTTTRIARTFAFAHQIVIGLGAALTRERCSAYYVGGAAVAIAGVSAYSLAKNLRTKVAHMRIRMLHARAVLLAPQPDAPVLLAPQPDFLSQLLGCATDSGSAAEPTGPNGRRLRCGPGRSRRFAAFQTTGARASALWQARSSSSPPLRVGPCRDSRPLRRVGRPRCSFSRSPRPLRLGRGPSTLPR